MRSTLAVSQTSTATARPPQARGDGLGALEVDVGDRHARAFAAIATAPARPMPEPPPTTSATLPSRRPLMPVLAPEQVRLPGQVLALAAVAPGRLGDGVLVDLDAEPGPVDDAPVAPSAIGSGS